MRRVALLLAAALALTGCGRDPVADAPASVTAEDRAIGEEQHPQLLEEFGGAYDAPEARYVATVGERVAAAAGLPGQCTFTLVNSNVVNAFAVPGCFIYVTRGLFAIVTSEAELASVLAHEVGHIAAAHSRRQQRRSIWRTLGVFAVSLTGSEILTRLASGAASWFGLRYSRGQEYESDDLGVRYLVEAGYDPFAAADMLDALARQEAFIVATGGRDAARSIPEWARTHPLTERRIARARETAAATGLADDELPEAEAAYLAEVDGLLWGDDPAQGFVIGRSFAHPVMRIAFDAPEGFTLTNSPRAIGLSGPGGISGEFGGGSGDGPLEAYARALAARAVGDVPAEIVDARALAVNGLPAVILQLAVATRDGTVPLAIAVYDAGGGQRYHFILISPPDDAGAQAIAALFGSFRLLSAAEAAQLRPRIVRTVAVRPGDTPERLAAAIADGNPRELFAMLNGRDPGQPLRPGERVKIVTYADGR